MTIATTAGTGCVEVDGGAVELSWSIRDPEGRATGCNLGASDAPPIAYVRICWQPLEPNTPFEQRCDPALSDRFRCELEHGVSGFEIEPGETAVWIEPVCEDGALPEPTRYEVPSPIVRSIESGGVATLSALLIVAAPDACQR